MYMQGPGESSESLESLPRGMHDPGAGRHTSGMDEPVRREQVVDDDAWSGPCVHNRGRRNRVLTSETQGSLNLESYLAQDMQGTPTGTRCPCGYLGL